jgi:hypothetical protein
MQNVLSALMALLLVALVTTSTASDRASTGYVDRATFSDDASIRSDETADTGAFIEPPLTTASTAERPVESAPVTVGSNEGTKQPQSQLSLSKSSLSSPWVPVSSSLRRARLHVYRL